MDCSNYFVVAEIHHRCVHYWANPFHKYSKTDDRSGKSCDYNLDFFQLHSYTSYTVCNEDFVKKNQLNFGYISQNG